MSQYPTATRLWESAFYEVIFLKSKILTILSYVAVAVAAAALTLCFTWNMGGHSKLDQLQELLLDRYVNGADATKLEDAAAHAMVGALGDRWSYYIPADEYAAFEEQKKNAYVGIGVTITVTEEGYSIQKLAEGGPAEEVGILAGDLIVAVDGQSVAGMDSNAGKALIQGKVGTQVKITVRRAGEEKTFSVTRRTVRTKVATATMLQDNIGLVTIANFNTNCYKETVAAIKTLREQGAVALIFDVRNNGGGYADELVKILDYLLPEGDLFRTIDYRGKESVDRSDASCLDMPMSVLVNGSSYSAAEFFAAALDEYDYAIVAGEKTSGKGHYQVTYQLSDGSAVGLSIGKYFTPKGVSLEGVGITPEVYVEVDAETAAAIYAGTLAPEEDPQIQAAIAALQGK